MADRITDERLRDFASSSPLVLAIAAQMGEPSWADVRAIAAELLAARAEVALLREGQAELARAVNFLDMCNKDRIASGETGALRDAWEWVEEAAREMIDAAKETP